jgi:hypothetical protein
VIVPITQANFGQYMQMGGGYMVNKTFKTEAPQIRFACAHDVAHHNRGYMEKVLSREEWCASIAHDILRCRMNRRKCYSGAFIYQIC